MSVTLPLEPTTVFRHPLETYDTGVLELAMENPRLISSRVPAASLWLVRAWVQAELHRREARAERRQRAPRRRIA